MKITKHQDRVLLDLWREIVFTKADHKCELCGSTRKKLDPHHIFGKRKKSTRYDPQNGVALCAYGCHKYGKYAAHEHPEWFRRWLIERIGENAYEILYVRSRTPAKIDYKLTKLYLEKELEKLKEIL